MPSNAVPQVLAPESQNLVSAVTNFRYRSPLSKLRIEYRRLLRQPISSVADLESFILDYEQLRAGLDAQSERLGLLSSTNTDSPQIQRRYQRFLSHTMPSFLTAQARLDEKYLNSEFRSQLPEERYGLYDRLKQQAGRLATPLIDVLSAREAAQIARYQAKLSGLKPQLGGEEFGFAASRFLLTHAHRGVRQAIWQARERCMAAAEPALSATFDQLVRLRHRQAVEAGFRNYVNYMHFYYGRFDYTVLECKSLQRRIERCLVPLVNSLWERKRQQLRVESIKPWDLIVDSNRRRLEPPHRNNEELVSQFAAVADRIHPYFGEHVRQMRQLGEVDLSPRPGKAFSYECHFFPDTRRPYVTMTLNRNVDDILMLAHEMGHAFNFIEARHEELYTYRDVPREFAELAAMSMELMTLENLAGVFNAADNRRVRQRYLGGLVFSLLDFAQSDAWQHWVYASPRACTEHRHAKWCELNQRFSPGIDWQGQEQYRHHQWIKDSLNFSHPLYCIQYIIAQLGAVQIWQNYRENPARTVRQYRQAMALGGSVTAKGLFKAAGIDFDFSRKTVERVAATLSEELRL